MKSPRDRRIYTLLLLVTIALGLASRHYGASFPPFVVAYAGDTLWACAAFFTIAIVMNQTRTLFVGLLALGVSCFVEFSQLYHASWLNSVRATTVGALLLGNGFLWSDIACYAAGVVLAGIVDLIVRAIRVP